MKNLCRLLFVSLFFFTFQSAIAQSDMRSNLGFELGNLTGWATWGASTVTSVAANVHSGTKAAEIKGRNTGIYTNPFLNIPLKQKYKLTVWGKGSDSNQSVYLKIDKINGTDYIDMQLKGNTWKEYSIYFTTGEFYAAGGVNITFWDKDNVLTGSFFIDDITIEPVFDLGNAGFELGNLTGWASWGTSTVTSVAANVHSGTKAAEVKGAGTGIYTWPFLKLQTNREYKLTLWGKGSNSSQSVYVKIDKLTGKPDVISTRLQGTTWTKYTVTFTTGSSFAEGGANITIWDKDNALSGSFFIDDIELVQTSVIGVSNSHLVTEYGSFIPNLSDASTIATNNATINNAIVTLGQAGGGIIVLPTGTFYIGPNPALADRAITIAYNNIGIYGAGIGQTILKTNGTWNVANARRGHGIIIQGTTNVNSPRKNIVLKNFEMDGQSGWTGIYNWPADPATGAGWDISHKGIIPSWDNFTDSVTIENVYVHRFSGEILYCGGFGMGKLSLKNVKSEDTNGSDFNLWAADLLVENCEFGGPTRFWIEIGARPSQNSNQTNKAIFRNNNFHDAKFNGAGIVMCQGNYETYTITFDGNTISNGFSVFAAYGGVAGPISITNNNISNCTQTILESYSVPGWINSANNKNLTMENNTITGASHFVAFNGWADNFAIRNNQYSGSYSVVYAGDSLGNNVVEGNTITNSRTPEEEWGWPFSGTRPLFQNNTYVNCEARNNQGTYYITGTTPLVTPHSEQVIVYSNLAYNVPQLAVNGYPQGQKIAITGGSASYPVRFATGQASYTVNSDKTLNGTNTLNFTFDAAQGKWIEDSGLKAAVINGSAKQPNPSKASEIILYPNPASTQLNISVPNNKEEVGIEVFNVLGVKVISKSTTGNMINIPLDDLNSGIYFVQIKQGDLNILKKIVVEK